MPVPALRARLELPVTGKPEGVLLRDLDGDGRGELIAVSREPGTLTVWREPPSGWDLLPLRFELPIGDYALGPLAFEFGEQSRVLIASRSEPSLALVDVLAEMGPKQVAQVALPAAPRAIAVGTLFGEEAPSALCIDREGALHIWTGNGEPRSQAGFSSQASCMLLAREGSLLAVGDRTKHEVQLYRLRDGRFESHALLRLNGIPRDIAEADTDGDGRAELHVAGGDDQLWSVDLDAQPIGQRIDSRAVGDIPLRLEVLPAAQAGAADGLLLLPFYRLQVMQFDRAHAEPTRTMYAGQTPWDLSSADWNGDGFREVVVANRDAHRISVVFGTQDGDWRVDQRIATGRGPDVVIGGKFTSSTEMQLASFCALEGTLQIHDAIDGSLVGAPIPVGAGASNPNAILPVPGGERDELIWTTVHAAAEGRSRAWLSGLEIEGEGLSAVMHCELSPSAADLLLVETYAGPELWVADDQTANLRRFDANCELRGEIIPGIPALSPTAIATWREDGLANIVAACRGANDTTKLFLYRETTSLWSDAEPLNAALIPIDVEAADVDGDGDIDICLLGKPRDGDGPGAVTVFLRDGDDWKPTPLLETGLRPYALKSGDLDGDGHFDLIVSAQNSHQLNLYFGRAGNAPLERSADLGAGTGSLGIWIGDLDSDGSPEIVAANAFSNDLSVIRSN